MDLVGAADRPRRGLAEPEEPHFALVHEPGHRADGLLDRDLRVHAVLIVEVDGLHAEPAQARVARARHVLGAAVHARTAVGVPHLTELGGEHRLPSPALDRPADEVFVVAPAVQIGGVEEVDAEVERPVNDPDRHRVVTLAVDAGHGHTAETDRGDG